MCQAGNLYRHCNVRVDSNLVKLTSVHPETSSSGPILRSRIFSILDIGAGCGLKGRQLFYHIINKWNKYGWQHIADFDFLDFKQIKPYRHY